MRALWGGVRPAFSCIFLSLFVVFLGILSSTAAFGQAQPRVVQPVDNAQRVTLTGNTHPLARPEFDHGAVEDSLPMARMLMLLKRSDDQEAALQQYLEQVQDKSSPNYHAWLTPEQFGAQYGPADSDIQAVTQWLTAQGFAIGKVYSGKTVIEFSGTSGQVRTAFSATIHSYQVNGKTYSANANDPQIPAALAPVISGIVSLNNFPRKSLNHEVGIFTREKGSGRAKLIQSANPELTFQCGTNQNNNEAIYCNALVPYDFATIYNVLPLWNTTPTAIDGTGETIALVAASNINTADITNFRSSFGLPAYAATCTTPPTAGCLNVIVNGPDPGLNDAETEADLDTEWSGGVAKGAAIDLVVSADTESSSAVDLSSLYIVDNDLAPVMSVSFGECELFLGSAGNQFYNSLWEQAAAEGISVFVAAGDNGAAACDIPQGATPPEPAKNGFAVSGLASTPFNFAVGGTDFNDLTTETTYWNTTSNNATTQQSALSYIPETTWNDSCTNALFATVGYSTNAETNCNNTQLVDYVMTIGGSGGQSSCTTPSGQTTATCAGHYPIPSWQTGQNVPLNGGRAVPDVSLFSGSGFVGNAYAVCEQDVQGGPCTSAFLGVGGTSGSSPAFAGIMALIDQKMQSRQGSANVILYKLFTKQTATSCNSSTGPASTCIFNDVTSGTNAMPCAKGSPNCTTNTPTDTYGVLAGFNAGAGYDLPTGLGSVNAANLVNNWSTITFLPSNTTLSASVNGTPATSISNITHGTAVSVTSDVSAVSGTGTPTGQVALMATPNPTLNAPPQNVGPSLGIEALPLSGGTASGSGVVLPGGTYTLTAHYQGDATFGASNSAGIPVTISPEPSKTLISIPTFNATTGAETGNTPTTLVYGSPYIGRIDVGNAQAALTYPPTAVCTPPSCPTGTITWTDSLNGAAATPLDGGSLTLNNAGYTEDITIQLPGGQHVLSASYPGDNSYKASSATYSINVTPATMQLTLTLPTSTVVGMPFTIYMSGTTTVVHGAPPMGTLTIYDGSTPVFTASGAGLGGYGGSGSGSEANAGFGIDTGITLSGQGSHTLTMTYSSDPNYSAVSTNPQVVHLVYPTILSMQSSATSINYGTSGTLTATLTTTQTSPPVTGQITFTSLSGQQTIVTGPTTQTTANGFVALQATATITPQSSDTYMASYAGDSNFAAASASSSYITVNNPSFIFVPSQPGLTITAGQSASIPIAVTPAYSLNSTVQLQIPTPVVQGITCSVSPNQIALSGTNSVTATLTCSVPAPSSSTSTTQVFPVTGPSWKPGNLAWGVSAVLAALALVFWLLPVRLRLRPLAYVCVLFGAISFAWGCGGGSSSGSGGGGGGGGATPTSMTLTVPSTKVSTSNLSATVQVTGNSPTGTVSLGVAGESYSFNTMSLTNGSAQFSYYLGAPGAFSMTAQYSGDSRNLASQIHTPLTVVQTGTAGNMTVSATIGPTTKQLSVALTIQ